MLNWLSPLSKKLVRDMWHIRGQIIAIAGVVACGVTVFVMSHGTLISLETTRDTYYERFRFADVFAHLERAPVRLLDKIATIDGVQVAEGRIIENASLDIDGMDEPAVARLISLPRAGGISLNALALRHGTLPDVGRTDQVVISEAFANAHQFSQGAKFAAIINGRKRPLTVAGIALSPEYVYSLGPGQLMPDDKRFGIVWMNRDALAAAFDMDRAFNDVSVTLLPGAMEAEVIRRIDTVLDPYGGVGAYGRKSQLSDSFLRSEMEQLGTIGTIIPPIFLGVAVFLLNVAATRLIETEREQIGLLKAFGYSDTTVGWHYLKMILSVAGVGVVIGWAGGVWLGEGVTRLYTEFYHFPIFHYRTDPAILMISGLLTMGLAAAACWRAIRRAATMPPAVAMAPPAPPSYHASLIERLVMMKRLSPPSRMIVRHITRWPVRSCLTILGVAMSLTLLIGTLYFNDSIEHMIESHYFNAHRYDMSVALTHPRTLSALDDIKSLQGVMAAEPTRSVAVRLRFNSRSNRTHLTGLTTAPDLHQLVTPAQTSITTPEWGLVLTDKLADMLGAQLGDMVAIDILEGRRPTVVLPLVALGGEYIGKPAYMDFNALNALMGDAPLMTGAAVQIDATQEADLFRRMKDLPAVAGVGLRSTAVKAFRDTMEETIDIMLTFYLFFGGLIAAGTVYNSARISLSERGRELAGLRVMGFSRAEVSYILLGELAALTVAAIPLGCLLGFGLAATLSNAFETELYRIPLVVNPDTFGTAIATVTGAAAVAGLLVRRRIDSLDLIAVLKTRE